MSERLQELPPPLGRRNSHLKHDVDGFSFPQDMDSDAAGPSRVSHVLDCTLSSSALLRVSQGQDSSHLHSICFSSSGGIILYSWAHYILVMTSGVGLHHQMLAAMQSLTSWIRHGTKVPGCKRVYK